MPRRKPKHSIQKGQVLNPNGRPVGSTNQINQRIKEAFTMILENKLPELEEWLTRAAQRDPLKTADLLLRISERFTPALSRTEITGPEGQAFTPITINLPTIPKVDVTTLNLGESTPIALPAAPAEEVKEIGEGNLTEDLEGSQESGNVLPFRESAPAFVIPKPILSANQLRDLKEMGMEPPTGLGEAGLTDSPQGDI